MATKKKMLQAAAGNAGGGAGLDVAEVFSTYLYEGNGSTQTITNGIDLDGEGGLVWQKGRSAAYDHKFTDTERGTGKTLTSVDNSAEQNQACVTQFNSDGFLVGTEGDTNANGSAYASWTFRKAPKFFDVVTWTGDGNNGRVISHNLGSTVGSIFIKRTDGSTNWFVHHRSIGESQALNLNFDGPAFSFTGIITNVTDASFTVSSSGNVNGNNDTYVAYLFAHNDGDGGFGPDGDQDIIKCGSVTSNSNGQIPFEDLGFEPQWIITKRTDGTSDWTIHDVMRGWGYNTASANSVAEALRANTSAAESGGSTAYSITPTGFYSNANFGANRSFIYIAIRRGPLAPPESATEVFEPIEWSYSGNGEYTLSNLDYMDTFWHKRRGAAEDHMRYDRLRGTTARFRTDGALEITDDNSWDTLWDNMNKFKYVSSAGSEWQGNQIGFAWKRAPNFFDVVAYTGDGTSIRDVNHNLGVIPELAILKRRDGTGNWLVTTLSDPNDSMRLNTNAAQTVDNAGIFLATYSTDSTFNIRNSALGNGSGEDYIAYLFASLDGISKVGSYTGNGSSQTIDCGFTSGARFILIKRTDSTGDWYVWDSVRGIVAGNDPYLELNTTDAEVTSTDWVDPDSSGFIVNGTTINASSAEYIFYSVA
ncbi:MAG: hypothetical protein HOJ68_10075 [Bacteroidetes bacterium]|jgi:hypothetical protein|nr:hypothetical protein [Bacteroidota bacterium]